MSVLRTNGPLVVNSNAEILFTTISVVTGAHQCICDVISICYEIQKIMEEILTLIQTLSSYPRFADRYIRCTLIDSDYMSDLFNIVSESHSRNLRSVSNDLLSIPLS